MSAVPRILAHYIVYNSTLYAQSVCIMSADKLNVEIIQFTEEIANTLFFNGVVLVDSDTRIKWAVNKLAEESIILLSAKELSIRLVELLKSDSCPEKSELEPYNYYHFV